jgi:hypothetical protein
MTTRDSTKIYSDETEEDSMSAFPLKSDKCETDLLLNKYTSLKWLDANHSNQKVIDDFSIIEDPRTDIKIKEITVYASHYIMAIEITYVEGDLTETKSEHASNLKYLNERPDIEKWTLTLEADEHIHYISYAFSSQNKFIRSLQIGTTGGHLMVLEGQIELNNMHAESGHESGTENEPSFNVNIIGKDKVESRKSDPRAFNNQSEIKPEIDDRKVSHSNKPLSYKVRKDFNAKSSRKMSFGKPGDKVQTLDMIKLKQRVVGLKTKFSEFLLGIELYTEPCTYADL